MITKNYLYGRKGLMAGDVPLDGATMGCLLVKGGSTFMLDDPANLAGFSLLNEFDSPSYARVLLTGNLLTVDTDRDKVIFSASNPLWALLDDDDFPFVGMIIFQDLGGDASNIPVYGYQLDTPVNPGGEDYEFPFSENGISEL